MIRLDQIKDKTLLRLGLGLMALRSLLQTMIDRSGHGNDFTDFALGVMMGCGIGITLLFVWRNGRRIRGQSTDACGR